jgi:hypothetical protein
MTTVGELNEKHVAKDPSGSHPGSLMRGLTLVGAR